MSVSFTAGPLFLFAGLFLLFLASPGGAGIASDLLQREVRVWQTKQTITLGVFGLILLIIGLFIIFAETSGSPTSPTPTPIQTPTLFSPTQTQIVNPTALYKGRLYTIEFVTGIIPDDGELHNVYYSIDGGAEQYLFTAGKQVNHTFSLTFSHSIQMRVAVKPETVLHEELYINGNLVISSDNANNNGLYYQVP